MSKGIISIILLIIAIGTFFLLTKPLYGEINGIREQKNSFEKALSDTKQIQETRDKLLSQYNTISQENLEGIDKILPSQPGSMKFILETESIAQKNGMALKKIDIKEGEKTTEQVDFGATAKLWETILFSAKLSGSYKSFYSFIKDVEKSFRLTDIKAVDFSSGEIDFYEFVVDGSFYWKK